MVQVLPNRNKSFADSILGGFANAAETVGGQILPIIQKQQQQKQEMDFLNQLLGGGTQQPETNASINGDIGTSPNQPTAQKQGFNPATIPDAAIAAATIKNPVLGRNLQHMKDVALREERLNREATPEHQREKAVASAQAQADIKYNEQLQESKKLQHIKSKTLEDLERLNKKGVTGKPFEKFLEKTGLTALTSAGRREFAADVKNLITDIKSILGGQFSNFEFQTILNAYPSADFSQEANAAIINNLKDFQDIRNQEHIIAENLKKENNGKLPEDYNAKVNERLSEYVQSKVADIKKNTEKVIREQYNVQPGFTLLVDPTDGEMLAVPDDQVANVLENGAYYP
jgi:hypothetical protein